jgi:hypothetical protein
VAKIVKTLLAAQTYKAYPAAMAGTPYAVICGGAAGARHRGITHNSSYYPLCTKVSAGSNQYMCMHGRMASQVHAIKKRNRLNFCKEKSF